MSDQTLSQIGARGASRNYLALFRFHYHCSFIGVLLGVLVVTHRWSGPLAGRIFLLYLSLNVLLYGGLYTLNAITDADSDSRRPFKDSRPVACGAVSRKAAASFAAGLIIAGFVTGWAWLGLEVMPVYLLLFVLNVSYSLFFRNLFLLDVLFNSATHPPRFLLGVWLAGGGLSWDWLALVLLFAVGMSASRRSVLLNHGSWESRGPLARYSTVNLLVIKCAALGAIGLLWVLSRPTFQIPYIVTVCAYVVFVGGIEALPRVRSAFETLWLR
jgi:decaprenyl-phosphate phosphoribosyltransferase